ncbi:4424_t:CDS:2, partial [Cetraspora pellucida]
SRGLIRTSNVRDCLLVLLTTMLCATGILSLIRQAPKSIFDGWIEKLNVNSTSLLQYPRTTPNWPEPNVQGLPKKCDAKVFIRLIEFDRDIQQPQFDGLLHGNQSQIPVRELMVNATLCRSYMILRQKNINFGIIDK